MVGIIPRAVDSLLAAFAVEAKEGTFKDHKLSMSYLEIYNEKASLVLLSRLALFPVFLQS